MYKLEDINMLVRRIEDEYPKYEKDGTFHRAIEDPLQSPMKYLKELDMLSKTSLVNQASSMKSKNNAQYIQALVQGGNIN